ncbi:MAG: glycosyltransferase [Planctomycetes bacterium]|nr:glycosyltransferase [Planctomycetota bacterium]
MNLRSLAHAILRRVRLVLHWLLMPVVKVLARTWRAAADAEKSSLWAGTPILNMAVNARAETLLGRRADSLVYSSYFITDQFTYNLSWARYVPLLGQMLPYFVLLWACRTYGRLHFYCDRGLLPQLERGRFNEDELALYQMLGKEIIFWTYGADVRTRKRTESLGEYNCCTHCPEPGRYCVCDDDLGRDNQKTLARYGHVFAMGDMIEYTPDSRNDLFFWPVDLDSDGGERYRPQYPDAKKTGPVRIVHAPNHRHFKGSKYLIDAVEVLKQDGVNVELVLVERIPNRQALEIYHTADIIFDQCLIGFHGYFANEAMAMGKPVLCFIRKPEEYLLVADECPIQSADAGALQETLRRLLSDPQQLRALGEQGRRYIETHHTLSEFAGRLRCAYEQLGWESSS